MCGVCGCADGNDGFRVQRSDGGHTHGHAHEHPHDHEHRHDHADQHGQTHQYHVHEPAAGGDRHKLEVDLLQKNDLLAERNRGWLEGRGVTAINLVSAPGSGKTTLLEQTLQSLHPRQPCAVIEGDQESQLDMQRVAATGCPAVQINTGSGCHLESDMVARGLRELDPQPGTLVMVENVGNLVCPALFDLGEQARVVLISVTEGEDKPLKYPHMIRSADLLLLTKIDLLPHLNFDIERCEAWARQVNPDIEILRVSASSGEGMSSWLDWLQSQQADHQPDETQAGLQESTAS